MFIEKLSNEKILAIAKKSTIDHFPKEWHANIDYEILDGEFKKVRNKPQIERTPCVTDSDGNPVEITLPTREFIKYPSKEEFGFAHIKISLNQLKKKPLKIGYVYMSDTIFSFYNIDMRRKLGRKVENVIAQEYPLSSYNKKTDTLSFDVIPEERKQTEISEQIYIQEMTTEIGKSFTKQWDKCKQEMDEFFKGHNIFVKPDEQA